MQYAGVTVSSYHTLIVCKTVYASIRAVVREREERLREAMLIVGLSESALYLSWWLSYTAIYAVIGTIQ